MKFILLNLALLLSISSTTPAHEGSAYDDDLFYQKAPRATLKSAILPLAEKGLINLATYTIVLHESTLATLFWTQAMGYSDTYRASVLLGTFGLSSASMMWMNSHLRELSERRWRSLVDRRPSFITRAGVKLALGAGMAHLLPQIAYKCAQVVSLLTP